MILEKVYHESDTIIALEIQLSAGVSFGKHKHTFSHLSILAKGKAVLSVEGSPDREIEAPYCVNVQKNLEHSLLALTDVVWYCTHSTDTESGV